MPARFVDMDAYTRMSWEDKRAVDQWVETYVAKGRCFRFDLAEDCGVLVARFYLYDEFRPEVVERPSHTVDVFGVAPCPVA